MTTAAQKFAAAIDQEARDQNDRVKAEYGVRALLRLMGQDPDRPGLADTPHRFVDAWLELCTPPNRFDNPADILARTFDDADYPADEMIAVGPLDFVSMCEHHLLPFTGVAWIAYIPAPGRVVGLSKLAHLLEHYARQPQVQERLTTQIAGAVEEHLKPVGSACVIRATHSCMALRGARKPGAAMVTSVLRGAFKDKPEARAELMGLTHGGNTA